MWESREVEQSGCKFFVALPSRGGACSPPGIAAGPMIAFPNRRLWKEPPRRRGGFCFCAFQSPRLPCEKPSDPAAESPR